MRRAKQRAYLTALAQHGQKMRAAREAEIDPAQPYRWAQKDPRFAEKLVDAQVLGEQVELARYEREIRRRALAGSDDAWSANLLMFRTKRLDPRYRDNATVQVAMTGPVAITMGCDPGDTPLPVVSGPAVSQSSGTKG